jgi:hypothetical protein
MRERIERYRSEPIGEQNTKAALIGPVLRALGWDTEDLSEVRLEYRRRPSDRPVDYALLIAGAPKLFIEAKALGQDLADRKWSNQIMAYAVVAGVNWVVLTDGDEYRIYNAHARVPVEDKLLKRVRISDAQGAQDTLLLLGKERLASMEEIWRDSHADRLVAAAIEALFIPPGDPGLVRLIRRRCPDLGPAAIRKSLTRVPRLGDLRLDEATPPASQPPTPLGVRRADTQRASGSLRVVELARAGLLTLPVTIEARYKGRELSARIETDGQVWFEGSRYASLSTAAAVARGSVIGRRADGRMPPTNGWSFWRIRSADGSLRPLSAIREPAGLRRREARQSSDFGSAI